MKTKVKLMSILALLFTLIAFLPNEAKAQQCPYKIVNKLNCPARVQIEIFRRNPQPPPNCILCSTYPDVIPAGGMPIPVTIPADCERCPDACNIKVTVVDINGMPPTGPNPWADFGTTPPGNFVMPGVPPCAPQGSAIRIQYDPITMTFTIY